MERDTRIAFLRALAQHLPEGAPLLLSYFALEGKPSLPDHVQNTVANTLRRIRRANPLESGDLMDWNCRHRFTDDEIRGELAEAGYETAHVSAEGYPHAVGIRRKIRNG